MGEKYIFSVFHFLFVTLSRSKEIKVVNMPDKDASTPRVFLIRHGETEWSQSGRFTGSSEIPLTDYGEEQVKGMGQVAFGSGQLIDPAKVAKVWVSPRERAVRTYELLSGSKDGCEVTEDLAEWNYGYAELQATMPYC